MKPEIEATETAARRMIVAVKGFVVRNRRALILRRSAGAPYSPGIWEYPGGRIEFGEGLQQALEREIAEETGLAADIGRLQYAVTLLTGPNRQIVVLNYKASVQAGQVRLSSEHDAFLWATQKDLFSLLEPKIRKHLLQFELLNNNDIEKR